MYVEVKVCYIIVVFLRHGVDVIDSSIKQVYIVCMCMYICMHVNLYVCMCVGVCVCHMIINQLLH